MRGEHQGDRDTWSAFAGLPGTRFLRRPLSQRNCELIAADGTVVARYRTPGFFYSPGRIILDDHEFKERISKWPLFNPPHDLLDVATGTPVLHTEGSHQHRRGATVVFSDEHRYTFPVQGKRIEHAVMTAVNESASAAFRTRLVPEPGSRRKRYEIVVEPDEPVTTELLCVICIGASLLTYYFMG